MGIYGICYLCSLHLLRMCLVNNAVYIAKYATKEQCEKLYGYAPGDCIDHGGEWTATGDQFAVPYVFKKLFSHEDIVFDDLCETFSVTSGALYLDMNESLPDVSMYEKELGKAEDKYKQGKLSDITFEETCKELNSKILDGHNYKFVGRVGQFTPVKAGKGGGVLLAQRGDKYDSASGAKGYRWVESDVIRGIGENAVDMTYFTKLVDEAIETINQYGDFEMFASDDPYIREDPKQKDPMPDFMNIPDKCPDEVPWD